MRALENYFIQRSDEARLKSYRQWSTVNEETLNLLIQEYFLSLECGDKECASMLSRVIDYLFDCYNG